MVKGNQSTKPRDRKDYMRGYMRDKRAGQSTGAVLRTANKVANSLECIQTAKALLNVLARQIEKVEKTEAGDDLSRARTIGYIVSVALRAVETASLESRITALEDKGLTEGIIEES